MKKSTEKKSALQQALILQQGISPSKLDWRLGALVLATCLLTLSVFFAWQAMLVFNETSGAAQAEQVRAWEVSTLTQLLKSTETRVQQALASPAVVEALTSGGEDGQQRAASVLKQQLPETLEADFYSEDIAEVMHADLASFGYTKAAMLVQAHNQRRPALIQSRAEGKDLRYLMLVQPVRRGEQIIAYASVQLPFEPVRQAFHQASLSHARVDLRQGDGRGDLVLDSVGVSASAPAPVDSGLPIAGSLFRIGVAQPEWFIVLPHTLWLIVPLTLLTLGIGLMLLWVRRVGIHEARAQMRLKPVPQNKEPTLAQTVIQKNPQESKSGAVKISTKQKPVAMKIEIDRSIFRAYDIRGVLNKTLNAEVARQIGMAIGSEAQERGLREMVVGRDGRLSGPELSTALIEGLRAAGCDVIDIGAVPTPVVYFATFSLNTGSGVMVTGSHNPPDYNGFKIVLGGETLSEGAIQNLFNRINENRFSSGSGGLQVMDLSRDYIDRITSDIQIERKLKVVVDCGNGIAGAIAPAVLEGIGCEVLPLYCDVDGNFPNHHPDPSDPHNLKDLILSVKQLGADIGVAFDGDGDRLGVVTKNGEIIFPDRLLMLFAIDVLSRNPGATIIYDVKCTGHLQPLIVKHSGVPLMWKTGHSLIKSKMRETNAELAGEMSGHFFFQERWYGFDDGIYSAARLMEILAADAQSADLQASFDRLPKGVSTPELKIPMPEGEHYRFIQKFTEKSTFEGARITTIDGVRADYADGWGLVRCSNTTPCLVLRFDADNDAALRRIQNTFRLQLQTLEPSLSMPF